MKNLPQNIENEVVDETVLEVPEEVSYQQLYKTEAQKVADLTTQLNEKNEQIQKILDAYQKQEARLNKVVKLYNAMQTTFQNLYLAED